MRNPNTIQLAFLGRITGWFEDGSSRLDSDLPPHLDGSWSLVNALWDYPEV